MVKVVINEIGLVLTTLPFQPHRIFVWNLHGLEKKTKINLFATHLTGRLAGVA